MVSLQAGTSLALSIRWRQIANTIVMSLLSYDLLPHPAAAANATVTLQIFASKDDHMNMHVQESFMGLIRSESVMFNICLVLVFSLLALRLKS